MNSDKELDPNTGLPPTVSLGDVFSRIQLAPHEIASLLSWFGDQFRGTAQSDLATKMTESSTAVLDPRFHGMEPPQDAQAQQRQQVQRRPAIDLGGEDKAAPSPTQGERADQRVEPWRTSAIQTRFQAPDGPRVNPAYQSSDDPRVNPVDATPDFTPNTGVQPNDATNRPQAVNEQTPVRTGGPSESPSPMTENASEQPADANR